MADDVTWPGNPTDWTPFVHNGEDHIDVISTPSSDGVTLLVGLQSDPKITWYKGIRVLADDGTELASVSTQDKQHGPNYCVLPDNWARLEFVKAKIGGVHTGMYQTPMKNQLVGETEGWTLTFRWTKD